MIYRVKKLLERPMTKKYHWYVVHMITQRSQNPTTTTTTNSNTEKEEYVSRHCYEHSALRENKRHHVAKESSLTSSSSSFVF